MKVRHVFLYTLATLSCLFLLSFSIAQSQQATDSEKLQNILQLLTILGGVDGLKRSMQDEITTLHEKHPGLKKEYWESLTREVDEKELPVLIDRLVTVYDTLLTHEEVSDMLRFYESPTWRAMVSPTSVGYRWVRTDRDGYGQDHDLNRRTRQRILAQHRLSPYSGPRLSGV